MPISTSGSSGTITGTFTNSTSVASALGSSNIAVFTTPNTANAIFTVNYQVIASTASTSNLNRAAISIPGIVGFSVSSGGSGGLVIDSTNESGTASGTFKCGPNTTLNIGVVCRNSGASSAATFSYRIQYDYVSIVVS